MSGRKDYTWDPSQGIQFATSTNRQMRAVAKAKSSTAVKRASAKPKSARALPILPYKSPSRISIPALPLEDYKSRPGPKVILFNGPEVVPRIKGIPDRFALGGSNDTEMGPTIERPATMRATKARTASPPTLEVQIGLQDSQVGSNYAEENRGQAASEARQEQLNSQLRGFKQTIKAKKTQARREHLVGKSEARKEIQALTRTRQKQIADSKSVERSSKLRSSFESVSSESGGEGENGENVLQQESLEESSWLDIEDIRAVSKKTISHRKANSISASKRAACEARLQAMEPDERGRRIIQQFDQAKASWGDRYVAIRLPFDNFIKTTKQLHDAIEETSKDVVLLRDMLRKTYPDGFHQWRDDLKAAFHNYREAMRLRLLIEGNPACWRYRAREMQIKGPFDVLWRSGLELRQLNVLRGVLRKSMQSYNEPSHAHKSRRCRQLLKENIMMEALKNIIAGNKFDFNEVLEDIVHGCNSPVEAERRSRMEPLWRYLRTQSSVRRQIIFLVRSSNLLPPERVRLFYALQTRNSEDHRQMSSLRIELEECVWESLTEQHRNGMTRAVGLKHTKAEVKRLGDNFAEAHPILPVSILPDSAWGLRGKSSVSSQEVKTSFPAKRLDDRHTANVLSKTNRHNTWGRLELQTPGDASTSGFVEGDTQSVNSRVPDVAKGAAITLIQGRKVDKDAVTDASRQQSLSTHGCLQLIEKILQAHSDLAHATSRLLLVVTMGIWNGMSSNNSPARGSHSDGSQSKAHGIKQAWDEVQRLDSAVRTQVKEAKLTAWPRRHAQQEISSRTRDNANYSQEATEQEAIRQESTDRRTNSSSKDAIRSRNIALDSGSTEQSLTVTSHDSDAISSVDISFEEDVVDFHDSAAVERRVIKTRQAVDTLAASRTHFHFTHSNPTKCDDLANLTVCEGAGIPSSAFKTTQSLGSPPLTGTHSSPIRDPSILEAHYKAGTWRELQNQAQANESVLHKDEQEPIVVAKEDPQSHTPLSYQIPEAVKREKMLASLSTGAAYWGFDLYRGPAGEKIKVHYCKSKETTERVAQLFLDQAVLGFDIEWKPQATITDGIKNNVSLIQLACEDRIALFHVARYQNCDSVDDFVAPTMKRIMESPNITKVGVGVKGDFKRLKKFLEIDAQGTFELSHLHTLIKFVAGDQRKINKKLVALARQVEEHLQLPLWKGEVRSSDWSKELKMQQILYAASDSYAGLQLFDVMEGKRKALDPTPPRPAHAELDLPIRLPDGVVAPTSDERREVEESINNNEGQPSGIETIAGDVLNPALEDNTKPTTSIADPSKQTKTPHITKRPKPPQIIVAEEWVSTWRLSLPQTYKPKATPAPLRAYALWHQQNLSVPDIAALLRDPPLLKSTVATYILEAIRLEKFAIQKDRIGDVLDLVPTALRQGKYSAIAKI
ncbi:MAG: hypothetical protein M1812_004649 [Candelaria pacifica]|nr:MAG: hypothetical protein M1812_004649 [Candelaria pacifica]